MAVKKEMAIKQERKLAKIEGKDGRNKKRDI